MASNTSNTTNIDSSWVLDSGATHHLYHNSLNLGNPTPFPRNDGVTVSNGVFILISNSCNTLINFLHIILSLNYVLHTPRVTSNLVFIHKLYKDNDILVEFHFNCFFIKENATRKVLLQGPYDKGLYKLIYHKGMAKNQVLPWKLSDVSTFATSFAWHDHLRHILDPMVHNIPTNDGINVIKSFSKLMCGFCELTKSPK